MRSIVVYAGLFCALLAGTAQAQSKQAVPLSPPPASGDGSVQTRMENAVVELLGVCESLRLRGADHDAATARFRQLGMSVVEGGGYWRRTTYLDPTNPMLEIMGFREPTGTNRRHTCTVTVTARGYDPDLMVARSRGALADVLGAPLVTFSPDREANGNRISSYTVGGNRTLSVGVRLPAPSSDGQAARHVAFSYGWTVD